MKEEVTGTLLIIDDDESMRELLEEDLGSRGHRVITAESAAEGRRELQEQEFDLVLTDLNLPGIDGISFCRELHNARPDLPVLIITAFGSLETAIEALRAGAYDFVTKPIDLDLLAHALRRALENRRLHERIRLLDEEMARNRPRGELLGESRPMRTVRELISRVAGLESSVLLTGESGTGKELAARALHQQSERRTGPFVAVNCAALPEQLLESELFGHVQGAFTDARSDRKGLFLEAHGGTLLLDEIGEMPLSLQPKLLRALEERRIRPVGGGREIPVDVRLVTATHRDLEQAVREGRFREDLFYRLNVISVEMPPLRRRGNDILLLAETFLQDFATRLNRPVRGLSAPVAGQLLAYDWPGNVRELRNVMARAVALTRHDHLMLEDLPPQVTTTEKGTTRIPELDSDAPLMRLGEVERRYIERVLDEVAGNRSVAARILGIDRKTLYRKLQGDH